MRLSKTIFDHLIALLRVRYLWSFALAKMHLLGNQNFSAIVKLC